MEHIYVGFVWLTDCLCRITALKSRNTIHETDAHLWLDSCHFNSFAWGCFCKPGHTIIIIKRYILHTYMYLTGAVKCDLCGFSHLYSKHSNSFPKGYNIGCVAAIYMLMWKLYLLRKK